MTIVGTAAGHRIGLLSPGTGSTHTTASEMEMLAPNGVTFVSRFLDGPRSLGLPDLVAMWPQIGPAAREIKRLGGVELIQVAGAPIILANGPRRVVDLVERAAGVPATTNMTAIANGLRRLGAGRIVVVTPYYPPEVVALIRRFLVDEGMDIAALVDGGAVPFGEHKRLSPWDTYRMAAGAFREASGAEALVVVGGGAPLHEVIGALETDIGAPVVASNFASLWNVLAMAGVHQPISGYGRLLASL